MNCDDTPLCIHIYVLLRLRNIIGNVKVALR